MIGRRHAGLEPHPPFAIDRNGLKEERPGSAPRSNRPRPRSRGALFPNRGEFHEAMNFMNFVSNPDTAQSVPLASRAPTKALRQATTSSRSTLSLSARQRRTLSSFGISSACRMASEISSLE